MSKININIKSPDVELTDNIRNYVTEKVSMLEKLINTEGDVGIIAEVEVGKTVRGQMHGEIFKAELNLEIAGRFYRSTSEKDDLYAAIDEMKDDMMRILRRSNSKHRDLLRRGSAKIKNIVRGFYRGRK